MPQPIVRNAPEGCTHCLPELRQAFPTYWEFDAWLLRFLQKGFLPAAALPVAAAAVTQQAAPHYCACPECGQVWALSYPENSWRGYFLPVAAASARHQQQQRLNRLRRLGCFGLLVLIGIWLAVQW